MWKSSNVSVSLSISIPPVTARPTLVALKSMSLNCLETTASSKAFLPFPPLIVVDRTLLILKFCGSTFISLTLPLTTACAFAVIPVPTEGAEISMNGGLITS